MSSRTTRLKCRLSHLVCCNRPSRIGGQERYRPQGVGDVSTGAFTLPTRANASRWLCSQPVTSLASDLNQLHGPMGSGVSSFCMVTTHWIDCLGLSWSV